MKDIGLWIISFILGAGLVFGYSHLNKPKTIPVPSTSVKTTIIPVPSFSIETPPSESLQGSISARLGRLFWESRTATEPAELTTDEKMKQGERLVTKSKSKATIQFETLTTITLSENSDISFVQTLPTDFVVEQKNGTIAYEINGTTPLSVRIRNALLTKNIGSLQIAMKDGDPIILISTIKGTADIGFNDANFVSQVFTLREGQVYEYNSDERTAINQNNK